MLVIPLPAPILDVMLTCNIALGVLLVLASMNVRRALDLSAFPSILLVATLFRLALNVSSTRLILLHAHAGDVIASFGNFVVGGSVVVGLVIFMILAVIQFVVITNGATRVAEVGARFTLDAMPGKQMAIDADLNAGIITEEDAKRRRADIAAEADFYGAMDGASKFVKGDAIAAVIITMINLIGGLIVGVVQKGMPIGEAISTYSLLTVGEGLVSMIPALLVSISSGLIVTRAAGDNDLGTDVVRQFARQHQAIKVGGVAMCVMALVPGLPKAPFIAIGAGSWFLGRKLEREAVRIGLIGDTEPEAVESPDSPESLARDMRVEPLELELAFDLVDLVDPTNGGDLLERVRALRRKLALELGIVIPTVRTRDNLDLPASTYVIKVHGVELGRGEAPLGCVLVIADDLEGFPGRPVTEPVFGLPAKWVPAEFRTQAEHRGATVVDRASMVTTHLAEIARRHAGTLLSRQDVKALVDLVKNTDPAVVDELNAANITLAEVQRVLQDLLDDRVAIRDLVRILEAIGERGRMSRDPEQLLEAVRGAIGPAISGAHASEGRLSVITIDPLTEQGMLGALVAGADGSFLGIEPEAAEALGQLVLHEVTQAEQNGINPVLVCSTQLRPALARLVRSVSPNLAVLSYAEIGPQLNIDTVGTVNLGHTANV
ncbi:MAG: flagellar biosynthesis protein FlhA [Acidimicrobiia bacterium]|nr:flagellar biosynthesis protein FlhA [Acidimicrobiia bacterium]